MIPPTRMMIGIYRIVYRYLPSSSKHYYMESEGVPIQLSTIPVWKYDTTIPNGRIISLVGRKALYFAETRIRVSLWF